MHYKPRYRHRGAAIRPGARSIWYRVTRRNASWLARSALFLPMPICRGGREGGGAIDHHRRCLVLVLAWRVCVGLSCSNGEGPGILLAQMPSATTEQHCVKKKSKKKFPCA